jgi:hypothetical protein
MESTDNRAIRLPPGNLPEISWVRRITGSQAWNENANADPSSAAADEG